jgi:hypothetical protein
MGQLDRFLAGLALAISAAVVGAAYLFRFESYSAFDRLTWALGFALGPWIVAGAVAILIYAAGRLLRFQPPLIELFFALAAGESAITLLQAFR